MAKVIGIDIGMTNCRMAIREDTRFRTIKVIANAEGYLATPSVITYGKNGNSYVGQMAKRRVGLDDKNTFHSVKRFLGRRYEEITQQASLVPYQVLCDRNNTILIDCPNLNTQFTPEEITAQILRNLTDAANRYLEEPVTEAILTVPNHFNDAQRQATKEAAKLAGIEVIRILNDANAVCLAHNLNGDSYQIILVVDLGGKTCSASVLESGDGLFDVLATHNNEYLGGKDFDQKIVDWLVSEVQCREGIDLSQDSLAMQQLAQVAETAKIELSSVGETWISLPLINAQSGWKHIELTLTRAEFEAMCSDLLKRCRLCIEKAIADARIIRDEEIETVVLAGGSSQIPAIQDLVQQLTGKEPKLTINPSEAVVMGAAIQAHFYRDNVFDRRKVSWFGCLCVTPLSLGIEIQDGLMCQIIKRQTFIPVKKSLLFSTTVDWQTSVYINILMGERALAKDNWSLGTLRLDGLLCAPKGVPQIEVTLALDPNETLLVTARDLTTGKEASIELFNTLNVACEAIERMRREAEIHAQEDRKLSEPIEARHNAATILYEAHEQLTQLVEKVLETDRDWIEGVIKNLQEAMRSTQDSLSISLSHKPPQALLPVATPVYSLAGAPTSSASPLLCGSSDNVIK